MSKLIVLISSDQETLELEEAVAVQSEQLKHMIEDGCAEGAIPIPNVTGKILAMTFKYCRRHAEAANSSDEEKQALAEFDSEFMNVDTSTLYDLVMAANYLEISSLLHLACEKVANMIKGKKPEEIRKTLNITNDYTPEEEAEVLADTKSYFPFPDEKSKVPKDDIACTFENMSI